MKSNPDDQDRLLEHRIQALEQGFHLGAWHVLPHINSLERLEPGQATGGDRIRVTSKAMQVLVQLAACAGEFVSKDELLATVWADRVVTEDVLTGSVRTLRRAMGDDARNPHIIETRKGAGYRLIAEVEPRRANPGAAKGLKLWTMVAAIVVVVVLSAGLALSKRSPQQQPTVAVLPFVSLSDEERDVYVASAMTDGLIVKLAERDRIRVISRTSILRYAEDLKPLPLIARELGADYLVEGSVLTGRLDLRISAQLIDARDDTHVWASRYDRPFDDILAIQSEVADRIAERIVGAVALPDEATSAHLSGHALDDLLEARYQLAQERPEAAEQALAVFDRLIDAHPDVAEGHLGKAQALLFLFKGYRRPPAVLAAAAGSATQALELNSQSAEAHRCLGQIIFFLTWDFSRTEAHYQRAIELNPSDTVARRRYAWLLVSARRYDDALAQIGEIKLLDPHYYASADGAMLLLFAGQYAEAVAELERINNAEHPSARGLRILSLAYWALERYDDSVVALIASRDAEGTLEEQDRLNAVFASEGRAGVYRYLLAADAFRSRVGKAGLYAQLGDRDAALAWLDLAVGQRDPEVPFVHSRPEFVHLHEDPRFQALVERIQRGR